MISSFALSSAKASSTDLLRTQRICHVNCSFLRFIRREGSLADAQNVGSPYRLPRLSRAADDRRRYQQSERRVLRTLS